jgi:cytochrome c-type biogenesis protein CcmE
MHFMFGLHTVVSWHFYFCNGSFTGAAGSDASMNKIQKRRLTYVIFFLVGLSIATSLIFYALRQNLNVFVTPSQLSQHSHVNLRLGGMVKKNSIKRDANSLQVEFVVTDFNSDVTVRYVGVLPDLFHEEKGMIAEGYMNADGVFIARQVLAKHDENYMPKNVYNALRQGEQKND